MIDTTNAKLVRISILNWAKKNDVNLKVEFNVEKLYGIVLTITPIDVPNTVIIAYYYLTNMVATIKAGPKSTKINLKSGEKIADQLIEIIKHTLDIE